MAHGSRFWVLCAIVLFAGCRATPAPPPPPQQVVIWKPVGAWSGHGDKQTETFTSETGGFRVHWETKNEAPVGGGTLHVIFRSGDSGREIIDAIDATGVGHGVEDVAADRPRWFYITIESAKVDWVVSVDERIDAQKTP